MYRSHPAQPKLPVDMSGPERRFAILESVQGIGGVFAAQPWRWFNHSAAVADASYKPHQLSVARDCKLAMPRSLITNDGSQARAFAAELGGDVIYKPLSTGVTSEQDDLRIIDTTRLTVDGLDERHDASIRFCPILLQQWVPKEFEVRLTVVGDQYFGVAVYAGSAESHVDWRSCYDDLLYEPCSVPEDVRSGVALAAGSPTGCPATGQATSRDMPPSARPH